MVWKVGMWLLLLLFVVIIILSISSHDRESPLPNTRPVKTEEPKVPNIPKENSLIFEDIEFPNNFFFGTASSDFQTTGGTGNSDWNDYINASQGKNKEGVIFVGPENGTDFLNRYKEDLNMAGQIGINVHRLSLEWARIEPEEGKWNKKAIYKYKEIFKYMRANGIEPMVCLNHFALPLWFSKIGGWENPDAAKYYARYAEFVAKNIGIPLQIKWWLTFNEPQFIILVPYAKGGWPPFKKIRDIKDVEGTQRMLLVASHVLDGHRLSYRAIHRIMDKRIKEKPMVGLASAPGAFYPNNPDPSSDDQLAYNIFNASNTLLLDYMLGSTDRDFIGLNYYGRTNLKLHIPSWKNPLNWLENKPFAIEWNPENRAQDERPKEFYPQALYDMIMKFKDIGLPIVITENGLNDDADKFREEFIVIHLKAIHDAIRDGANIIGYQYWALTDTWEWDGFFSQMGLIKINRKDGSLDRSIRPSASTYAEIIKTKKITKELLEKYKELLTIN